MANVTWDDQPQGNKAVKWDAPNAQAEQPSAVSRLASNFIDNTPIGAAVNLGKDYIQHNSQNTANGDGLLSGFHALGQTIWDVSNGITNSTVNAAQKTAAAAKAGDIRSFIQQAPGMVPLVGPAAVHAGEQVDAGDYAGAAGTSLGLVGSAAAPHIIKAAAPVVDSASEVASRVMTNSKAAIPAASKSAVQGAIATLKAVKAAGTLNVPAVLKAAQTIKAAGGDIVTTLGNILGPTSLEKATITEPALAALVADRNLAVQMGVNDLKAKLQATQNEPPSQPAQVIPATQTPSGRVPGSFATQKPELTPTPIGPRQAPLWQKSDTSIQKAGDSESGDLVTNVRSPITLPSGRKIGGFNSQALAPDTHSILTQAATENDGAALKALPADAKAALVDAVKKGDSETVQSILENGKPPAPASPSLDPEVHQRLVQAEQDGSLKALPVEAKTALTQASRDGKSDLANYILKYGRKPSPSELNHFISSERKADVFNEYFNSPEFVQNAQATGVSVDPQTYAADPVARQAIADAAFANRFNNYVKANKIDVSRLNRSQLKDIRVKAGLPGDGYRGTHESAFDILKQRADSN